MSFSVDGMCSASTVYSLMGKFEDKEKLSKVPKEESEKKKGGGIRKRGEMQILGKSKKASVLVILGKKDCICGYNLE